MALERSPPGGRVCIWPLVVVDAHGCVTMLEKRVLYFELRASNPLRTCLSRRSLEVGQCHLLWRYGLAKSAHSIVVRIAMIQRRTSRSLHEVNSGSYFDQCVVIQENAAVANAHEHRAWRGRSQIRASNSHVASVFCYSRTVVRRADRDHIARLDQTCKGSVRPRSKETSQKRQRVIFVHVESGGGH